jgi:hypothetical protein
MLREIQATLYSILPSLVVENRVFFDLRFGLQHPSTERLLQRRIIYVRKHIAGFGGPGFLAMYAVSAGMQAISIC